MAARIPAVTRTRGRLETALVMRAMDYGLWTMDQRLLTTRGARRGAPLLSQSEREQRTPGGDGDVMLAADRVGDGAGRHHAADGHLPQQGAGPGVERVEVALAAAAEQEIGRRGQHPGVGDVGHLEVPLL